MRTGQGRGRWGRLADAFTEPDDRVTLLESWPNDDGGWSVTVTFIRTDFDMRYRIYAVCMDAPPVS